MVKHIIFDCDGVLIDTEIVAAEVMVDWLSTHRVAISIPEFIVTYTGKTFSDIIALLKAEKRLAKNLDVSSSVPALDEEIRSRVRPIQGVWEMLEAIDLPKSVVSNSAADYVAEALEKLEITHHFEGRIFSAEMVEKAKPNPMVYELAIQTLEIPKEELIAIEDSATGVQAAIGAGIPTIGFLGGSHIQQGHGEKLQDIGIFQLAHNHEELRQMLRLVNKD